MLVGERPYGKEGLPPHPPTTSPELSASRDSGKGLWTLGLVIVTFGAADVLAQGGQLLGGRSLCEV